MTRYEPGRAFSERRVRGLPRAFGHDVRFDAVRLGAGEGCRITDRFELALPFGLVGRLVETVLFRRRMRRAVRERLESLRQLAER